MEKSISKDDEDEPYETLSENEINTKSNLSYSSDTSTTKEDENSTEFKQPKMINSLEATYDQN